jgi:hypothetical protein
VIEHLASKQGPWVQSPALKEKKKKRKKEKINGGMIVYNFLLRNLILPQVTFGEERK